MRNSEIKAMQPKDQMNKLSFINPGANLGSGRNTLARNYGINGLPLPVVPPFRNPHLFRSSLRKFQPEPRGAP